MTIFYSEQPVWAEPLHQLEYQYKGFTVRKSKGFQLYYIVPPTGKILHRELEGEYTRRATLEISIDGFLKRHGSIDEAYIDPEPPAPKRGRPPIDRSKQTTEETSLT